MGQVIDIDSTREHVVAELICIKCGKRWISVRPSGLWLKDMECPGCGMVEFVIMTGQEME